MKYYFGINRDFITEHFTYIQFMLDKINLLKVKI